ncbi:MoxR-like ATPase [Streptomyces collinus]
MQGAIERRLRPGAVERAGFRTVRAVLDAGPHPMRQVPGVGQRTADQTLAAARQLAGAAGEAVAVHLDVDRNEPGTTALVGALHVLA